MTEGPQQILDEGFRVLLVHCVLFGAGYRRLVQKVGFAHKEVVGQAIGLNVSVTGSNKVVSPLVPERSRVL